VLQQSVYVREVLMQGAAEGDVHHLRASADAERRDRCAIGRTQERDLERIAPRLDAVVVRTALRAVPRRVDIATTDQEEPVECDQQLIRIRLFAGWQDRRSCAGPAERVDVGRRDSVAALRPARHSAGFQAIRRNGDQRPAAVHLCRICATSGSKLCGRRVVARGAGMAALGPA
jgi:hypothetical protein